MVFGGLRAPKTITQTITLQHYLKVVIFSRIPQRA
jgi:hypothetical protein